MELLHTLLTIAGLTVITLVTRGFFLLPRKPLELPPRVRQALRFAPIAALVGVIAPEVLIASALGAVWVKAAAVVLAGAYYLWRRGILGTIVVGMVAYWVLRFGVG
ncbi:MAG: AzlD domain-containing protein [Betaproteobacteria bacterium]|nr:AzlD domain-containing protein [Betaproteobacteria bacterium]MDE2047385.1 AzlD domain-containing protein [Betaproteobacteria bacterium]MDE2048643.1 AzlD domain-containing protein [Betaproteobacteria bacterium]